MQIVSSSDKEPFRHVKLVHGKEYINWSMRYYEKQSGLSVTGVFGDINGYWASLPSEKQALIFDVYRRISEAISNIVDAMMLKVKLVEYVSELYRHTPYEDFSKWVTGNIMIHTPPEMRDTYAELEIAKRSTAGDDYSATTYLRQEYIDLVKLAIFFKPMVPIWAEYAIAFDTSSGKSNFREYNAMSLIMNTEINRLPAMDRLRVYMSASIPTSDNSFSALLGGLGSSEVPDWLMSSVMIRKICLIDTKILSTNNITSVLYHSTANTLKSMKRWFTGTVKDKTATKVIGDDGEETPFAENYKIKQDKSDADLRIRSVYTQAMERVILKVDETIDKTIIRAVKRNNASAMKDFIPTEGQMTLLAWAVSPAISVHAISHLDRQSLMSTMLAGQAILWHWGFYDLALLLTSDETRTQDGLLLGGVTSQSRIPREYVDLFSEMCPYHPDSTNKKVRQINVACTAIDDMARSFVKCDWILRAPEELIELGTHMDERNVMIVPSDIRTHISKLVEKLVLIQETRSTHVK